jgi:hypothetical protein
MNEQLDKASLKDIIDSATLIQEYVKDIVFKASEMTCLE